MAYCRYTTIFVVVVVVVVVIVVVVVVVVVCVFFQMNGFFPKDFRLRAPSFRKTVHPHKRAALLS